MSNLMLGCDFSEEHVDAIKSLVSRGKMLNWPSRVAGVYGSPRGANPFGSVRPLKRETAVTKVQFMTRVRELHHIGVSVNLTLNSMVPKIKAPNSGIGMQILSANELDSSAARAFKDFVSDNREYVDGWIIAHPGIVDLMHTFPSSWSLKIIVSTIMNVHTLPQLHWIKRNWPLVKRVCPALWKNRNFNWLLKATKIIPLELLANEFCSIEGNECEGLYRQSCYLSQSLESGWNPMLTRCIKGRDDHPESWLMARFIMPQWLDYYQMRFDIASFKITGRTHPAEFIKFIGEAYCSEKFDGNLLELWGQLPATLDKGNWKKHQREGVESVTLPARLVESMIKNFPCNDDDCGICCQACLARYRYIKRELKKNG